MPPPCRKDLFLNKLEEESCILIGLGKDDKFIIASGKDAYFSGIAGDLSLSDTGKVDGHFHIGGIDGVIVVDGGVIA